jgi:hypothetical protein
MEADRHIPIEQLDLESCRVRAADEARERAAIAAYVEQYARDPAAVPPVQVWDCGDWVVVDGWHRCKAAAEAGLSPVPAVLVGRGTVMEAQYCALTMKNLGRLTQADDCERVRQALGHGLFRGAPLRVIAEELSVGEDLVGEVQAQRDAELARERAERERAERELEKAVQAAAGRIQELRGEGETPRSIARILAAEGYRARHGGRWLHTEVLRQLERA